MSSLSASLRQHFEKVIPLSDTEFEVVLSHFSTKSLKKKEFLFRENDAVEYIYFIVSGLTKLSVIDYDGNEHVVSFAMEDWWETDTLAFYTQTKATMSLQCLEDCELYCLSLAYYRELCETLQKVEHFFLEKSIASHIANQKRILALTTLNAKDRYDALLKQKPALFQRLPKSLLASYLGVSRETLSRLLS